MNAKTRFLRHGWPFFLIWAVVSYVISDLAFLAKTNVKEEAKFGLFVAAHHVDAPGLRENIESMALPGIEETNVYAYDPNDNNYAEMFSLLGLRNSTCLVLPSSLLETDFSYCAPFSENEAKSLFPEAKYTQKDGSFYGFLLYDAETKQGKWQEYISYTEENYYLCFRKGALQVGDHIHFAENQIITSFLKGIFTE